jgi:hypothetical protein
VTSRPCPKEEEKDEDREVNDKSRFVFTVKKREETKRASNGFLHFRPPLMSAADNFVQGSSRVH